VQRGVATAQLVEATIGTVSAEREREKKGTELLSLSDYRAQAAQPPPAPAAAVPPAVPASAPSRPPTTLVPAPSAPPAPAPEAPAAPEPLPPEPPRSTGRPTLTVLVGPSDVGRTYPIQEVVARIGRHGDNDVVLDHPSVSRYHARVLFGYQPAPPPDALLIEDLNSANGTLVNDRRVVGTTRLADGDRVRIGEFTLGVAYGER